jgi:hypothetical protein
MPLLEHTRHASRHFVRIHTPIIIRTLQVWQDFSSEQTQQGVTLAQGGACR